MLLHGAYVFSAIAHFMRANREQHLSYAGRLHLSAARGRQPSYGNIDEAAEFRLMQVREAVTQLKSSARLSDYGVRALEVIRSRCAAFG